MKNFTLPFVDVQATPKQAADALIKAGRSAVIVRSGADLRLIDEHTIVSAIEVGTKNLDGISSLLRVEIVPQPQRYLSSLSASNFAGVVIEQGRLTGFDANIFTSHDHLADTFLSPPGVAKCENPNDPHYYPPRSRAALPDSAVCFCGYRLP